MSDAGYSEAFSRDGVVVVRAQLDVAAMQRLEAMFDAQFNNADRYNLYPGDDGEAVQVSSKAERLQGNARALQDDYLDLARRTPISEIVRAIFPGEEIFYFGTQLWFKQTGPSGRPTRRTPWHQDTAYFPFEGLGLANFWISLEDLPAESVLEVVRGTHRGRVYNACGFDPNDPSATLYDETLVPRIPDIDADRGRYDIFSCDMRRGDMLVFHPGCIHGGAPTFAGQRRRTLSFRFFSESVVYAPRPAIRKDNEYARQREEEEFVKSHYSGLQAGDPFLRCMDYARVGTSLLEVNEGKQAKMLEGLASASTAVK